MPIIIPTGAGAATEAYDVGNVADQAARLALADDSGQIVQQADNGLTYIQVASPASDNNNWVELASADEVIVNAGALAGAAPTGAKLGVDDTTGDLYYVSGGNWTAIPSGDASVTVVADQTARLALADSNGQVVEQTDTGQLWKQTANDATLTGSWTRIDSPTMSGANQNAAGEGGLSPQPQAGDQKKFLQGDATFDDPDQRTRLVLDAPVLANGGSPSINFLSNRNWLIDADATVASFTLGASGDTNGSDPFDASIILQTAHAVGTTINFNPAQFFDEFGVALAPITVTSAEPLVLDFVFVDDTFRVRRRSTPEISASNPEALTMTSSTGNMQVTTAGGDAIITVALNDDGGTILPPVGAVAGNKLTYVINGVGDNFCYFDTAFKQYNGVDGASLLVSRAGGQLIVSFESEDGTTWVASEPGREVYLNNADYLNFSYYAGDTVYSTQLNVELSPDDGSTYSGLTNTIASRPINDVNTQNGVVGVTNQASITPDLTTGFRSFHVLSGDVVTAVDYANPTPPTSAPPLGTEFYIDIVCSNSVDVTLSFGIEYLDKSGAQLGDIVIPASNPFVSFVTLAFEVSFEGGSYVYRCVNRLNETADPSRTFETVSQVAHGFAPLQPVYDTGAGWAAAQADDSTTVAEGIVTRINSVDEFEVTTHGLATVVNGLVVGEYYWLDQASSAVTAAQPTSGIAQSVLKVVSANQVRVDIGQAISISGGTVEEENRVLIGSGTGGYQAAAAITSILDTLSWNDVAAEYEKIEIVWNAENAGADNRQVLTLDAAQIVASTELAFFFNGSFFANMTLGTLTTPGGPVATSFGGYTGFEVVAVYGIRPQKTVISPLAAVVDFASALDANNAAYMDIGPWRFQWGADPVNSDNQETITFPLPFADTNYTLSCSLIDNPSVATSGGAGADVGTPIRYGTKTTTGFNYNRDDDIDGMNVNWMAIGLKP